MSEVMGTGAPSELRTVESEAQGIGAGIINFFRSMMDTISTWMTYIANWIMIQFASMIQDPQKALLFFGSLAILYA